MTAAEDSGLLAQHLDHLIDQLSLVEPVGVLIGHVRVFAADQSDT
jgi:hypothetical protein